MSASYKHLANDGSSEIESQTWSDAYAGVAQTAQKFGVENNGDRTLNNVSCSIVQIGTNDGNAQLRVGADTATISKPWNVTAVAGAAGSGGTWGATGQYFWVVTAVKGGGETIRSAEVTVILTDTTQKVTLSWAQVPGATGYKVYRSNASGSYVGNALAYTINSGATTQYLDGGGALSAGAPPSTNTTGGAAPGYGTPPTLGAGPLTVGSLAVGQQWFYWVNRVVPSGTSESGNPRQALIQFKEN